MDKRRMVYAIAFHRLDFIRVGKDSAGKRKYYFSTVSNEQLKLARALVLRSIGLSHLTKHM